MKRKLQKEWLRSYLWSGPSLLLIALVVVFPILYTFYISLTNMNVYHWFDFTIIGLENYIRALFVFDSGFLSALLVTVLWTVVNMVLQLVIAFVLASLLNVQKLRFRKLYKTLLMFPWAMPGLCLHSSLENRNVQHTVRLAEPVDGKAGAGDYAVAILGCVGVYLLHGCQSLAGAAVYDYDYGWRYAEHRQKLL